MTTPASLSSIGLLAPTTGVVVVLVMLLAGGVACIAMALRRGWRGIRRARNGCVADAEVVGLLEQGGSPDDRSYVTLVEFRDRRGELYRIRSRWAESPAPFKVGQAVRVSYEADDPREADIVEQTRSLVIWLGVLGLMFTLIATVLLADMLRYGLTVR